MYIVVDIGGTKTLVVAFSEEGVVLRESKKPTSHIFDTFINDLCEHLEEVAGGVTPRAIAIAAPGKIDPKTEVLIRFGNLDWQNVDIKKQVAKKYDCPISIDNDANIGALNEARRGAATDYNEVLYITISTGIGTGIIIDGRIDPALADSEGGQMHFRHNDKLVRWEHFASGKAFFERYGKMGAEIEDPNIWNEWSEDVSLGLGSLLAVIGPDVVVIGGSMGVHLHKYRDQLLKHLEAVRSPLIDIPPIIAATDPDNAVINGCYVLASDSVV